MTREIPLTQGLVALIDDEDYEEVSQLTWHAAFRRGSGPYATAHTKDGRKTKVLMHRLIMKAKVGEQVDHINGAGLDNRRSNLRRVTQSQNLANMRRKVTNTSGFKGVRRCDTVAPRWAAEITVSRVVHYSRPFDTPEDAANAYDEMARQFFGQFARVNFPKDGEQAA